MASWGLDVFGGIRHTVQARGALADVAQEDLRDVQVTLTAEVARAYFELRGAQEQLQVARQNAENQRRTFDLTRERPASDRKSTRLNSSHLVISYAVFCLKKKKNYS